MADSKNLCGFCIFHFSTGHLTSFSFLFFFTTWIQFAVCQRLSGWKWLHRWAGARRSATRPLPEEQEGEGRVGEGGSDPTAQQVQFVTMAERHALCTSLLTDQVKPLWCRLILMVSLDRPPGDRREEPGGLQAEHHESVRRGEALPRRARNRPVPGANRLIPFFSVVVSLHFLCLPTLFPCDHAHYQLPGWTYTRCMCQTPSPDPQWPFKNECQVHCQNT